MAWWTSLVGEIARVGLTWLSRRRLPRVDGALHVAGPEGAVEVLRDRWGVPHIYAESEHDLYFAQGFVHAQDRLWQMDLNRRLVAGRLAEVLGSDALPLDRWIRTLRMRWVAEREAEALPAPMRELARSVRRGRECLRGPGAPARRVRASRLSARALGAGGHPFVGQDDVVESLGQLGGGAVAAASRRPARARAGSRAGARFPGPLPDDHPTGLGRRRGGQRCRSECA